MSKKLEEQIKSDYVAMGCSNKKNGGLFEKRYEET